MKKTRTVKIGKDEMLLDDWEKAKERACQKFVKEWNNLMPCKANHLTTLKFKLAVNNWLWDNYSDEVLR